MESSAQDSVLFATIGSPSPVLVLATKATDEAVRGNDVSPMTCGIPLNLAHLVFVLLKQNHSKLLSCFILGFRAK